MRRSYSRLLVVALGCVSLGAFGSLLLACDNEVLPTHSEEQLHTASSLASNLARSLETLPGVSDARVHIALSDTPDFAARLSPSPRASVLLHALGDRTRIDVAAVQSLVAGAVSGLTPSAVQVVIAPAAGSPTPAAPKLSRVGPFVVAAASENSLRVLLATMLATQAVLAALLVLVLGRKKAR